MGGEVVFNLNWSEIALIIIFQITFIWIGYYLLKDDRNNINMENMSLVLIFSTMANCIASMIIIALSKATDSNGIYVIASLIAFVMVNIFAFASIKFITKNLTFKSGE